MRGTGDREVVRVGAAQRGFVHHDQLVAAGLTRHAIAHRVATGWLAAYLPRVYLVGRPTLEPWGAETAAVLFYRGHALLSHATATALWGMTEPDAAVTVTLVAHDAHRRPEIAIHRAQALHPADLCLHQGLPVTAPGRSIIDYAARASGAEVEQAMAQARVQRLLRPGELEAALGRAPHRKGTAAVRALLATERDPAFTRRELERRFLALIRGAQLPAPRVNARLHGFEVDFLWPEQRLVVETDGGQFHAHPRAFETDRRRDQILVAHGYRVIRVTWRQLLQEPLAVIARLTMALVNHAA